MHNSTVLALKLDNNKESSDNYEIKYMYCIIIFSLPTLIDWLLCIYLRILYLPLNSLVYRQTPDLQTHSD